MWDLKLHFNRIPKSSKVCIHEKIGFCTNMRILSMKCVNFSFYRMYSNFKFSCCKMFRCYFGIPYKNFTANFTSQHCMEFTCSIHLKLDIRLYSADHNCGSEKGQICFLTDNCVTFKMTIYYEFRHFSERNIGLYSAKFDNLQLCYESFRKTS